MKITGTLINYYIHCKRQCWLFANKLNMEDNSEDVHIGRVIHEIKGGAKDDTEISIDNIKIDKITEQYLVEIKKSDADIEAVKWQTLYYMKVLRDKGIERKGRIEFYEKNKQEKKVIHLQLDINLEQSLQEIIDSLEELLGSKEPPKAIRTAKCRKCAYFEYCFI